MKLLLSAAGTAILFSAPAFGQPRDDSRINQKILYGDEACPPSTDEEIVVCARLPEEERFRIPPRLRSDPNDPKNDSWANKATELSYAGRDGVGSCSPAGAGGASGCFNELVRQARAERAARDEVNWNRLIEEERQKRLARVDEDAEAVERELRGD
jgi:hypothetical protein